MAVQRLQLVAMLIAVALLSAPRGLLPCVTGDCASACCGSDSGNVESEREARCCCTPEQQECLTIPAPEPDQPTHHSRGPCDCPPGCPAPCASGKLPCPPPETPGLGFDLKPVGVVAGPSDLPPPDVLSTSLFRPPRIC